MPTSNRSDASRTHVDRAAWVESPLQLINAVELAAHDGEPLVVVPRAGVTQLPETAEALRTALPDWVSIAAPVTAPSRSAVASARRRVVGDVFSGQFRLLSARSPGVPLTIVDDGSATIHFATAVAGGAPFVRMAQAEGLAMRLLGSRLRSALLSGARRGQVALFTAYADVPVVAALSAQGFQLSTNRYSWLQSSALQTPRPRSSVAVLGTALLTDGQIEAHRYHSWLARIARDHGGVDYLPHRREDPMQRSAVAALPGITVADAALPVELVLAGAPAVSRVITLPSSAAASLRHVLRESVQLEVVPVPSEWWLPGADPSLRRAFDEMVNGAPSQ